MVDFSEKEFEYIINEFKNIVKILNDNDKNSYELKDYIEELDKDSINFAIENADFTDIDILNSNKEINKKFVNAIWDIENYWVWIERGIDTAEELLEYIDNKIYCDIFEKILIAEMEEKYENKNDSNEEIEL